ncbi:uncharacterized protein N7482_000378 [Penicillium canariense]|uniref:F-box domain-containing protein n=1 Tax=Penicillium canariense TaxID=189055 RepID=A0A9W9LS38_9EURO|nr:uncharacterized protein N7482_000378 [Penicillium canariense]KAJ5174501.1 hypothetical protein N7482_000378 [Penicillium canariense]
MPSPLERLPNELLDQIISYLDTEPPSQRQLHKEPDHDITQSRNKSLKHLSQSCSRLATLVRPVLFACARFVLHDAPAQFCTFVLRYGLARHIKSIVVLIYDKHPRKSLVGLWLGQIIDSIDPLRITVLAPPRVIGETFQISINENDSWAFGIEQQILQLEQNSYGNVVAHPPNQSAYILSARPWTSISFNEASCLKAYNHYEYFLSQVPSVMGRWGQSLPLMYPSGVNPHFQGLTSLSYTAIFPFYNHVEHVFTAMHFMPQLRVVTVQLAPDEDNHATEIEQRGSLDPNDPWMELESSYSVIGFKVATKPSLVEFRSRDLHVQAVRPELTRILKVQLLGWTHDGHGVWRRSAHQGPV